MKYDEFKEHVIEAARAEGLAEYELYYSSSEDTTVEAFRHEINSFTSSAEGGVCFRTLFNGQMGYASTEDMSSEEAVEIVTQLAFYCGWPKAWSTFPMIAEVWPDEE